MPLDTSLLERSLALPAKDRAELAEQLLRSLDSDERDPDAERLWAEEISRRQQSVRDGTAGLVDWEEAVGRVREQLRKDANP